MALSSDERYYIKLKASYLYYKENKTQTEIAELFNISRPTLIKLLDDARREGIVTIDIHDTRNDNPYIELEQQLRKKLGIKDVKIVNVNDDSIEAINAGIGAAAQTYLVNSLSSGMTIGMGWGRTLETMIRYFRPSSLSNLSIVSLLGVTGSASASDYSMYANSLCEAMASNVLNASLFPMYAPLVAQDSAAAQTFLASDMVANTYRKYSELDIAIVGIDGDPGHSTTVEMEKTLQPLLHEMERKGIVGNICARFYDADGNIRPLSIDEHILSISAGQLRKTPVVIGAAGGRYKAASILGGARAGLFNILITDSYTAQEIL